MKKYAFLLFAIISLAGMLAISGCNRPETYIVTFNSNGGAGTMAAQTFTEGEAQALTRNAFTYDGYTFTGWNTVQGGSGTSYADGQTITATADMILYAQWTSNGTNPTPGPAPSNTVTVTFNANGGTGEMTPQTFTVGTAQALSANTFTRENHLYSGWNTSSDGSGTAYRNLQEITISESITLYAQWHEYVDLGLPSGLLWATCNVGSTTPEGYGDYFAWGETTTKETYSWDNYKYYDGSNLTKYTGSDGLTTLQSSDDAATANWGSGWRMPTYDEMLELKNNCTVTWSTQNGVNGRLFTGPNGNSIFLPAAGDRFDGYDGEGDSAGSDGYVWSSSLYTRNPYYAWYLLFYSDGYGMYEGFRYCGLSVRPVCASQN